MKTNKGILKMCEKYTFHGITDLGEIGNSICDNCGTPLRYIATIKGSTGEVYHVGTECAKTLSHANIDNIYSMELAFKEFKKIAEARLFLEKGENILIYGYKQRKDKIVIAGKKGKSIKKICIEPVFDMFKNEQLEFIDSFINETYKRYSESIIYDWCYAFVFNHLDNLKDGRTNRKTGAEIITG